jgi:hypothetical protein
MIMSDLAQEIADEAEAFIEELAGPLPEETAPVVEADETTEPAAKEPEAPAAEEKTPAPPSDWEEWKAKQEERQRETRASFDQERRVSAQLQRELDELRASAQKGSDAPKVDPLSEYEEKFDEDPKAAIAALTANLKSEHDAEIAKLREEIAAEQQNAYVRELERQEAVARKAHDDYDTVVTEYLTGKMESDPSLAAKWRQNGGTAEAAYELGKQLKAYEEYEKDPSGFEARMKEKLLAEIKEGKTAAPIGDTLATDNSQGVKSKAKHITIDTQDILGEIFGN